MSIGWLLPLLLLACVAVASVLLVTVSQRRKQLLRRLETVIPTGPPIGVLTEPTRSIRVARPRDSQLNRAALLLRVPQDLPLAHAVPPGWVFTFATIAAAGAIWVAHYLTSWPLSMLGGAVVWVFLARSTFGWELARYRAKLLSQLPDAVQLVVSATRAGLPVYEAFRAIADEMPSPTRDEFVRVNNEMALGVAAEEALLSMHQRTGVTEYAIFAVTIGVQARSGGRLAETIHNLAETVRERLAIAARARALAGEAKISAIIMAALPVLAGGLLSFVQPGHLTPLFTDPRGVRMFMAGVVTLFLGVVTMRQLIRGATTD
jgi:tight adherence protein B